MMLECSSCHDPHVAYDDWHPLADGNEDLAYMPFLIMPNSASALCLSCHNK